MKITTNLTESDINSNKEHFKNYIAFKMTQYARLTNFDYKQIDAKNKLKQLSETKLKEWTREAYASLIYKQTN